MAPSPLEAFQMSSRALLAAPSVLAWACLCGYGCCALCGPSIAAGASRGTPCSALRAGRRHRRRSPAATGSSPAVQAAQHPIPALRARARVLCGRQQALLAPGGSPIATSTSCPCCRAPACRCRPPTSRSTGRPLGSLVTIPRTPPTIPSSAD